MSKLQRGRKMDPLRQPMPDEALATYITLGRQLAARVATTNFRFLTEEPGWTIDQVEIATEHAIARMDLGARDQWTKQGAYLGDEHWQAIWTAMEAAYREATAALLCDANFRGGCSLQ